MHGHQGISDAIRTRLEAWLDDPAEPGSLGAVLAEQTEEEVKHDYGKLGPIAMQAVEAARIAGIAAGERRERERSQARAGQG